MIKILEKISLQTHHTFSTPAIARWFTSFSSIAECQQLIATDIWQENQHIVLGEGSNTLFTDDYPGLVAIDKIQGISITQEDEDCVTLTIGGGTNWNQLVNYCVDKNLCGIENLSLIPGTVGAAPIQNIGAYGTELSDVFIELTALSAKDGTPSIFSKTDCQFGYRNSIFKNVLKNKFIICDVTLKLSKKINLNLDYDRIKPTLEKMNIKNPTLKDVRDAVTIIRNSKLPNPEKIPNAGSFFKNPIINKNDFEKFLHAFPDAPYYETENSAYKIPAAWLIEECGWKGKMLDDTVGVYENHSLVLINPGKVSGNHVLELANRIHLDVFQKFNISLEPEINIF